MSYKFDYFLEYPSFVVLFVDKGIVWFIYLLNKLNKKKHDPNDKTKVIFWRITKSSNQNKN